MKNLENFGVQELSANEINQTNGGWLGRLTGSLFRSTLYMGANAVKGCLGLMGALAGLGDGLRKGMGK